MENEFRSAALPFSIASSSPTHTRLQIHATARVFPQKNHPDIGICDLSIEAYLQLYQYWCCESANLSRPRSKMLCEETFGSPK